MQTRDKAGTEEILKKSRERSESETRRECKRDRV